MLDVSTLDLSQFDERTINQLNEYAGVFEYEPTLVLGWLMKSPCKITCLFLGNQYGKGECISGDTLVRTTNGDIPAGQLYEDGKPFGVYSWDRGKLVPAVASKLIKKHWPHRMYRITLSDGQWVEASENHRILTVSGEYATVGALYDVLHGLPRRSSQSTVSMPVGVFSPPQSSLEPCQSTHDGDDLRCGRTGQDSQGNYQHDPRCDDGQPLSVRDSGQSSVPLSTDALPHMICCEQRMDVPACICANNQKSSPSHPSSSYVSDQNGGRYAESLYQVSHTIPELYLRKSQNGQQPLSASINPPQSSSSVPLRGPSVYSSAFYSPVCFMGNKVYSIEFIGCQEVYDFEVPIYHNYLAGGLIHHNTAIMDYWHRVNGTHPNPHKNFKPEDKIRVVRFASENLPGENVEAEVKNTQYPVLKRRFLPSWIKKDITARHPVVTVKPVLGGKPVQFEFVSYGQTVQAGAGVQRASVWIDESCPPAFFYEQLPRLLAGDGDIIVTLTPVPGNLGWEFDELFERARIIVRTQTVIDRIYQRTGERVPMHERTNSKDDIMVIMAATDDNPIYEKLAKKKSERTGRVITVNDYITDILGMMDDEDMVDARRYGMFKQLSGKLFKSFTERTHVIPFDHYFPDGIPHDWKHFRGIDWHESTPWACGWIAVSPHDEIFVYNEFNPSPEKMITAEIMRIIATRSQDYKFDLNLVDPLAAKIQPNTGISSLEDMNRIMAAYKREGLGTGGYWTVWDTKSQKGRDEIRKRLMNSVKVGKPFNNMVIDGARKEYLPTIWFTDNCRQTILSLKNWRREEWANTKLNSYKEEKETPQQKWSHFCTMLEGLLKRPEVFQARFRGEGKKRLPLY